MFANKTLLLNAQLMFYFQLEAREKSSTFVFSIKIQPTSDIDFKSLFFSPVDSTDSVVVVNRKPIIPTLLRR